MKWILSASTFCIVAFVAVLIFLEPESFAQPAPKQDRPSAVKPAVAPAPVAPQRTETSVQDSWTVMCQEMPGASKKTCSATLQVIDGEKKQVLFGWVIGKTPEGALTAVFQTPTGILVQRGVELKIGEGAARKINFVACTSLRCEAATALDDALIKEASLTPNVAATIYLVDGRSVNYKMNIKGFDKAVAAVR